jgi:hypothetical protein
LPARGNYTWSISLNGRSHGAIGSIKRGSRRCENLRNFASIPRIVSCQYFFLFAAFAHDHAACRHTPAASNKVNFAIDACCHRNFADAITKQHDDLVRRTNHVSRQTVS